MNPSVQKICAFCGSYGPFSREHVIPAFLYRRYPDQKFGYNPKAGRYVEWEAVVSDVCNACNSGSLSSLDEYAKTFFEQNRCHRTFRSRSIIRLVYDYEMLLRWLLKVTYNAMRAVGRDTLIISECVGYILRSAPLPFYPELLVEVIRDAPISEDGRYVVPESMKAENFLTAQRFRIGEFGFGQAKRSCSSRFVALNAFYFYFVLFQTSTSSEEVQAFLREIRRHLPQAIRLKSVKKSIEIKVSKRTIWEAYQDQALRELPAWVEYVATHGSDKYESDRKGGF